MMLQFSIMHGLGNRFAIFDGFEDSKTVSMLDGASVALGLCHKEAPFQLDGVIFLDPDPELKASVRMRIWNADGSDGVMCGNGLRCVAKLMRQRGHVLVDSFLVRTGAGVVAVRTQWDGKIVEQVAVEMGVPKFELPQIPALPRLLTVAETIGGASVVELDGVRGVLVSVGNPHFVIAAQIGSREIDLEKLGPVLEHHDAFPERINVQIMQVLGRDRVALRTWERGAGLTQACATGACAAVVAGAVLDVLERSASVHMAGGPLQVEWHESSGMVEQTGAATLELDGVPMPTDDLAAKSI
jgi:diaminopimelate epimerase